MTAPWMYVLEGKPKEARTKQEAQEIADMLRKSDPNYTRCLYVMTVYEPVRVSLTGINNIPPVPDNPPPALRPDDV